MSEILKFNSLEDTIAAIATPIGSGSVGIVRLSGPAALSIADQVFETRRGKPSEFKTYTVHYGNIVRRQGQTNETIDEALLTVMRAPKSYTCEDVVEISCHGGMMAVNAVLTLVLEKGARLAEPGEFTKRAFLNGRIDLTQAEAVLDIVRAKTQAGLRVFEHQLKGELSSFLEDIRGKLMAGYGDIEAAVNFPDDAGDQDASPEIIGQLQDISAMVKKLLANAEQGRVLREGIKLVICGRPNVGKSSLLNVLLRQERAIVSPIEGTTRDTIEESAQIKGVPFQIVDTAGILEPRDMIEEEAVRRSHLHIQQADLVLFMVDASVPVDDQDLKLAGQLQGVEKIIVVNKMDLNPNFVLQEAHGFLRADGQAVQISLLQGQGLDELEQMILKHALHGQAFQSKGLLLTNIRHIEALRKALSEVDQAIEECGRRISAEFISERIRLAVDELDRITGRSADSDLLDHIFSEFCIGK